MCMLTCSPTADGGSCRINTDASCLTSRKLLATQYRTLWACAEVTTSPSANPSGSEENTGEENHSRRGHTLYSQLQHRSEPLIC